MRRASPRAAAGSRTATRAAAPTARTTGGSTRSRRAARASPSRSRRSRGRRARCATTRPRARRAKAARKATRTPSASSPRPSSFETCEGRLWPATWCCWVSQAAGAEQVHSEHRDAGAERERRARRPPASARRRGRCAPISAKGIASAAEAFIAVAAASATPPARSRPLSTHSAAAARTTPNSVSLCAPPTAKITTSGLRP